MNPQTPDIRPPVQPAQPGISPAVPTHPSPTGPVLPIAKRRQGGGKFKSALSTIAILLIAPLIALFITAFVFQSYEVDGQSMQNTLQNNDRLIIWKVPRTWSRLTNHDYIPNRGDIVVFVKKGLYEFSSGSEKQLIKRVIALPGERVVVKDGVVTVFNKQYPDGFVPDKTLPYASAIPAQTDGNVDITVPAGEVFVCGDNRANSLDSRSFGTLPTNDIVGKLTARILPLSDAQKF